MDNTKNIKKLIKLMRNEGVLCLKSDGIEISLSPGSLFPQEAKSKAAPDTEPNQLTDGLINSEDILYWSSPGFGSQEEV